MRFPGELISHQILWLSRGIWEGLALCQPAPAGGPSLQLGADLLQRSLFSQSLIL